MEYKPTPCKVTVKWCDLEATAFSGDLEDAKLTAYSMLWSQVYQQRWESGDCEPLVPSISTFGGCSQALDSFIRDWNEEVGDEDEDGHDFRYKVTVEFL